MKKMHAQRWGLQGSKNANEMQNKRELNGSSESRCTKMSTSNEIKLRRQRKKQRIEMHTHTAISYFHGIIRIYFVDSTYFVPDLIFFCLPIYRTVTKSVKETDDSKIRTSDFGPSDFGTAKRAKMGNTSPIPRYFFSSPFFWMMNAVHVHIECTSLSILLWFFLSH